MTSQSNYEGRHTPETGPSTYLHAGAGSRGWPHDHSVEDTYEVPPFVWTPRPAVRAFEAHKSREYAAVFDGQGLALLVLNEDTQTTIAKFDTYADAQTAAEALNEHHGY